MATMTEAPFLTHVPVLTGGYGRDEVRRFYSAYFVGRWPADPPAGDIARRNHARGLRAGGVISRQVDGDHLSDGVYIKPVARRAIAQRRCI